MEITGTATGDNQRVELHQLEYFVAVAEELSFTRGARRAHVVQSAVSAAITRLERELHAPLFERTRRRVALTDAGSALLPEARATLAAAQGARDAVAAVRGGLRGSVTLGMMLSTGPLDMAAVLGRFSAAHPDVVVQARQAAEGTAAHLRDLREGALDLALVALAGSPPPGIVTWPLASEHLSLLAPPDGPYARRARVRPGRGAPGPVHRGPGGLGQPGRGRPRLRRPRPAADGSVRGHRLPDRGGHGPHRARGRAAAGLVSPGTGRAVRRGPGRRHRGRPDLDDLPGCSGGPPAVGRRPGPAGRHHRGGVAACSTVGSGSGNSSAP